MKDNRRIQKGSGVYTCIDCKEQTRETGEGESQFDLCAACYEIAGMENQHSDDGHAGELNACSECQRQMTPKARAKLLTR